MTAQEFFVEASKYIAQNPGLRLGQCYYNLFENYEPELAASIR